MDVTAHFALPGEFCARCGGKNFAVVRGYSHHSLGEPTYTSVTFECQDCKNSWGRRGYSRIEDLLARSPFDLPEETEAERLGLV